MLRRFANPYRSGGRASKFLGYPKTQLASTKTSKLTDVQTVEYTDVALRHKKARHFGRAVNTNIKHRLRFHLIVQQLSHLKDSKQLDPFSFFLIL